MKLCKRLLPLLVLCLLLGGCRSAEPEGPQSPQSDFPTIEMNGNGAALAVASSYHEEDKTELFASEQGEYFLANFSANSAGELYALSSDNDIWKWNGGAWELVEGYGWLQDEDIADFYIRDMEMLGDGTLLVLRSGQSIETDQVVGEMQLYAGDADACQLLASGDANSESRCFVDEAGTVCYFVQTLEGGSTVTAVDLAKKEELYQSNLNQTSYAANVSNMAVAGGRLYLLRPGTRSVLAYDLKDGQFLEETTISAWPQEPQQLFAVNSAQDGKGLLYANETGLYYLPVETMEPQLLCKSAILSKAALLDSLNVLQDGSILLVAYETGADGAVALRYLLYTPGEQGSAEAAADPSQEEDALVLYALQDSTAFQTLLRALEKDPTLKIKYQVGTDGDIPAADAQRNLAAQLLAGSGPDVLFLDGLPLYSYMEKGILADIKQLIPENTLENITHAYAQADGAVPAVPTRFNALALLGEDVPNMTSLTELADWVETLDIRDINVGVNGQTRLWFPFFMPDWVEGETYHEDVFRMDLEAMKRMADLWQEDSVIEDTNYGFGTAVSTAGIWHEGFVGGGAFTIGGMGGLQAVYSALLDKPGELALFGDVFEPQAVVGINAQGGHREQAEKVVSMLLSEEVQQEGEEYMGFPVVKSVLQSNIDALEEDPQGEAVWEIQSTDPMPIVWLTEGVGPSKAFVEGFVDELGTLTAPASMDEELASMVREFALPYLLGETDLDSTLQQLKNRLNIYLAE